MLHAPIPTDFLDELRKRALSLAETMAEDLRKQPAAPHVVVERLQHAKRVAAQISTIADLAQLEGC